MNGGCVGCGLVDDEPEGGTDRVGVVAVEGGDDGDVLQVHAPGQPAVGAHLSLPAH